MTETERKAFTQLVHRTHQEMGGRASAAAVAAHVLLLIDDAKRNDILRRGCEAQVAAALRAKNPDTGLPIAPCVDGQYVQETLLSLDEYAYLIATHVKAAKAETQRVRAYQNQCQSVHGVWLDSEDCVKRFAG